MGQVAMDEFLRELQASIGGHRCAVSDQLEAKSGEEPIQLDSCRVRKHLGQHLLHDRAVVSFDDQHFFERVGQHSGSEQTRKTSTQNYRPSVARRRGLSRFVRCHVLSVLSLDAH